MGRLILVRHGESIWNQQNRFTGWVDVSLTNKGIAQAGEAGELLADECFDVAFTSALIRAQDTLYEILQHNHYAGKYLCVHEKDSSWYEHYTADEADRNQLKIHISEQLNERYYGDLQGMNKDKARKKFGVEQVRLWRRSYDVPPPGGESLEMTAARTRPYFNSHILQPLRENKRILVSAHGNSLRSIVMHIKQMSPKQILGYEIATGTPHIFDFNEQIQLTGDFIMKG